MFGSLRRHDPDQVPAVGGSPAALSARSAPDSRAIFTQGSADPPRRARAAAGATRLGNRRPAEMPALEPHNGSRCRQPTRLGRAALRHYVLHQTLARGAVHRGHGRRRCPMTGPANVVVVGAGLAGLRTIEELRARGYAGRITLVGAETRPPYDRPPLSKKLMTGELDDTSLRADLAALDIDVRLGEVATKLRPGTLSTDRGELDFEALVLATGAAPIRLPGPGRQHVLRTLDDALALRELLGPGTQLCVVGAGWIGAELATAARTRGCQVTVLEAADAPLAAAVGAGDRRDHGGLVRASRRGPAAGPAGRLDRGGRRRAGRRRLDRRRRGGHRGRGPPGGGVAGRLRRRAGQRGGSRRPVADLGGRGLRRR